MKGDGLSKGFTASLALVAALLLPQPGRADTAAPCNDVALVLAVDSSASVSPGEYLLQQHGIAAAFRDPAVLAAIARAGRVSAAVVFWGSEGQPKMQSDWVDVSSPAAADRFAETVEAMPRRVTGDTGLGSGLVAALNRLTASNICAVRRIINVSGDGEETRAVRGKRRASPPPAVRDLARSMQVEINALAIATDQPGLADYFERNVITGPDAFVMQVSDYADFAAALRRKLVREISPRVVSGLAISPDTRTP